MQPTQYFWDENAVRYRLLQCQDGANFNWLFFPGGPGADSAYLEGLVTALNLPGNSWLIDMPANGTNKLANQENYNFDRWYDYFIPMIKKLPNPILVGHSFGGMFPLQFPILENLLRGFVILNSAPGLWMEAAAAKAAEKNIPILTEPMDAFTANPNEATFKKAIQACYPYYFTPKAMAAGAALLDSLVSNFYAADWWLKKTNEENFNATWVPQTVPTLIVGGTEDCIVPVELFAKDARFNRDNITQTVIDDAGHAPWIEDMPAVKNAFARFIEGLV